MPAGPGGGADTTLKSRRNAKALDDPLELGLHLREVLFLRLGCAGVQQVVLDRHLGDEVLETPCALHEVVLICAICTHVFTHAAGERVKEGGTNDAGR